MSEANPQANPHLISQSDDHQSGGGGHFSSIAFTLENESRSNSIVLSARTVENLPREVRVSEIRASGSIGGDDSSIANNEFQHPFPDVSILSESTAFV